MNRAARSGERTLAHVTLYALGSAVFSGDLPVSSRHREKELLMSAFIITRIHVGDYDTWRPMFDQDVPRAREKAKVQRVFRDVDDPNQVFVFLEFASADEANEARRRVVESGVLDRFEDKHGPNVVQEVAG
jgi:hypothetical protein